ncbi:5-formyltetrahydrofolate cyclo-ligase-like isoform X3 [Dysidea avara]|uniref:5-formyltetrahydrofolate cyclo-ligase-like isoform X2 n=1 Tax=Dysidea avara TaxID=196820 RepID=UPI003316E81D
MAALKVAKSELRKSLKRAIMGLNEVDRHQQSISLCQKLIATSAYQSSKRVSVFISMNDEVDTTPIIHDVLKTNRLLYVPWYDPNNVTMKMLRVTSLDDYNSLPMTKWGVKQPVGDDDREESHDLDLVVTPGLGFTMDGKRIGRGKGYYDNYLSKCRASGHTAITIAMAFSVQICDELPTGSHDMTLDHVIHL